MLQHIEKADEVEGFAEAALKQVGLDQGPGKPSPRQGESFPKQICSHHASSGKKSLQFGQNETGAATMLEHIFDGANVRDQPGCCRNTSVPRPEPEMAVFSRKQWLEVFGVV